MDEVNFSASVLSFLISIANFLVDVFFYINFSSELLLIITFHCDRKDHGT